VAFSPAPAYRREAERVMPLHLPRVAFDNLDNADFIGLDLAADAWKRWKAAGTRHWIDTRVPLRRRSSLNIVHQNLASAHRLKEE